MENRARVLLEVKKKKSQNPRPLFLLIRTRAGPLMNKPHRWRSFETDCFALLHMLITSGEDVDPFLCFLRSGPTCQLDACALGGRRRSDFMRPDASVEPEFSLSDVLQTHLSLSQTVLLNMASSDQRWRWRRRENMTFPFRGEAEHASHG